MQYSPSTHTLLAARIVKTARSSVSMAPALVAAAICLAAATPAVAQDLWPTVPYDTITNLGTLPGGNFSSALRISADGSVIVGIAGTPLVQRAVSWVNGSTTATDLGTLLDGNSSSARGVSADGSVIVGFATNVLNERRAVKWVGGSTTVTELITLPGDNFSGAAGVSADGGVIVGAARNPTSPELLRAVKWVGGSTTATNLGTLGGNSSEAGSVSADGLVIVGQARTLSGAQRAVKWVNGSLLATVLEPTLNGISSSSRGVSADGSVIVGEVETAAGFARAVSWVGGSTTATELGTLGGLYSSAVGVSADGRVIVGFANNAASFERAVSWVGGSTTATELGTLGGDSSFANAVNADGSVIVGYADVDANNRHAVSWVGGSTTATDLGTLGGNFSTANAVSADGSVIVGESRIEGGGNRAFIWRTQMQDLVNLMLSYPVLANDTDIAVAQQQGLVGQLANQTCLAAPGASCMRTSLMGNSTDGTSSDGIGSYSSLTGLISYGYGVSDSLTLGANLNFGSTSLNNNGFDMGSDFGATLWGSYSEGQLARTGWQGEVALGYGRASGDITRGRGLDNVLLSTGQADMDTRMARASLGYGFNQAQGWLLTPTFGITNTRTTRDAYTETGGDFNASYDSLTIDRTTMDLSLSGETAINDISRLTLTGGLEHDLSADRAVLTGTSDMPGMEAFSVGSTLDRRDTRGFFAAEYAYDLSETQTLSGSLKAGQAAYGSKLQVGLGISFDMKF
jgi:probable HAF family extracellular repeat protein